MKVMVTGGAGFIGSHIVDALCSKGLEVSVLDDLSTGRIENIKQNIKLYYGHLQDKDFVRGTILAENPSIIIHQAAQSCAYKSLADPAHDAGVNILGTVNLLEASLDSGVKKIIYASSAAVYGSPCYLPIDPKHPVKPLSFYGLAKYSAEKYIEIFNEIYGLDYTILRYANVYGPGQQAAAEGGVVAIFIYSLLKGIKPIIYGDGLQTRDFIHVLDVVDANLQCLKKGSGMTYNIGTGEPTTIKRLYEIIQEESGLESSAVYQAARAGDIKDSFLTDSRVADELGWRPKISLTQGIKSTLEQF